MVGSPPFSLAFAYLLIYLFEFIYFRFANFSLDCSITAYGTMCFCCVWIVGKLFAGNLKCRLHALDGCFIENEVQLQSINVLQIFRWGCFHCKFMCVHVWACIISFKILKWGEFKTWIGLNCGYCSYFDVAELFTLKEEGQTIIPCTD